MDTYHSFDPSNARVLALLSAFLNERADAVQPGAVRDVMTCGVTEEQAFAMLLAAACGLDIADSAGDARLYRAYFPGMIHALDAGVYRADPYYARVRFPAAVFGDCALRTEAYQPYEAFVCDDLLALPDGRVLPQVGFFREAFPYPAVLEGGRIWMTVTPNEIVTMRGPVARCAGKVLALGLGLGYYAFMAAQKADVRSVTVIEQNPAVIELFTTHLLPQFPRAGKIRVVQADAFTYLDTHLAEERYDAVFADLWHDVSDGLDMYLRLKAYEALSPGTRFDYWIEKSIQCYL